MCLIRVGAELCRAVALQELSLRHTVTWQECGEIPGHVCVCVCVCVCVPPDTGGKHKRISVSRVSRSNLVC